MLEDVRDQGRSPAGASRRRSTINIGSFLCYCSVLRCDDAVALSLISPRAGASENRTHCCDWLGRVVMVTQGPRAGLDWPRGVGAQRPGGVVSQHVCVYYSVASGR